MKSRGAELWKDLNQNLVGASEKFTIRVIDTRINQAAAEEVEKVLQSVSEAFCRAFQIPLTDAPLLERIKDRIDWLERRVSELEAQEVKTLETDRKYIVQEEIRVCIELCNQHKKKGKRDRKPDYTAAAEAIADAIYRRFKNL